MNARGERAASVPPLHYPPELPVSARRHDILEALQANPVVVVCGETGSGKTTQLPKICLEAGRGLAGYIGHTQPRRIAARAVATRIAAELGQPLGAAVGYKIRFQDRTRPESLVKVMTDGILLAEIQADRRLSRYDTLIIDEAHERSLNIDFLLGYLCWLLPRRRDLKLIITSATIDPERFSRHFGGAPIINVSGRTFPVEIRYRPVAVEEGDETDDSLQLAILDAVDELWRDQPGDILVFLSGEREIRETAESLRKHHPRGCEILPLYSRLSQAEQERVFRPSGVRRVVLSTNVAETSLTVPGIGAVIDTGVARISRYSHRSRLQRLPIERISQASANQRSGRCGRVGPGIAIRLYDEEDFLARPEYTEPEIRRTNLAAVILQMHALRLAEDASGVESFPFVEPPDGRYVRDGVRTLQELGALDEAGAMTPVGRDLGRLPLDPRLGRILLGAARERCVAEALTIVAALSVADPRERPAEKATQADQKHAVFRDERSDFLSLLKLWEEVQKQRAALSRAKFRAWCRDNYLSYIRLAEWHDIHGQLLDLVKGELKLTVNDQPASYDAIHRALLTGLLSHVAQRREQNEYLGARGQKMHIHPGSGQHRARPAWIVAAEQVETTRVYARIVARIDPAWVEVAGAHLVRRHYFEPRWERRAARAMVQERTTLFGLTLQSGRKLPYERVDPAAARELFIRHALVQMDFDARAPFLEHNKRLLEEAELLQHKGRRVDLLADEAQLFAFFDARVPAGVASGAAFEAWRRKAERDDPRLLFLRKEDIAGSAGDGLDPRDFPDELQAGELRLKLEYRFDPADPRDGVTARVPLHLLQQVDPAPFDWLVPGLLEEKIAALIRALPKALRVLFVPVPAHASRAQSDLVPGRGRLRAELARLLTRYSGQTVREADFRDDLLPPHLRMGFAVVDADGAVVDHGRDLAALRERHGAAAHRSFVTIADRALMHTGSTRWTFGDLPPVVAASPGAEGVQGHPALVDEGGTVGVRLFATRAEADASHLRGTVRLIRLALAREMKSLRRDLPADVQAELAYRQLPPHPFLHADLRGERDLRDDALDAAVRAAFLEGHEPPRTEAAFDALLPAGRAAIAPLVRQLGTALATALSEWRQLRPRAAAAAPAIRDDVLEQLDRLMYQGFVAATPAARLKELPRYLQAVRLRLDKAADLARDRRLAAEVEPLERRYWQSVRASSGAARPEEDGFRWLLEELRVSLFAQQLRTPVPVSGKRLEEAWRVRQPGT